MIDYLPRIKRSERREKIKERLVLVAYGVLLAVSFGVI